ncbi:hypothetical protein [Candidatus Lokiarchaeum ossiferum]|uniref:hypothetical protein n=1 Tax=Candidatus Lokiarchaeum ossiferum TaxID=2951803 RepID=UPI00352EC7EF
MAEMKDIFQKLIAIFDQSDLVYVIVGGFAAILRGSARTTSDIDVIISPDLKSGIKVSKEELIDKLINVFQLGGFDVMEQQLRLILNEGSNASVYLKDSVIRIDLKIAKTMDEYEVVENAVEGVFQSIKFPIASIEQILYGKILYLGDISDLSDGELLDFNDVRDFINVYRTASDVDLDWLSKKITKKGLSDTLKRLLRTANKF